MLCALIASGCSSAGTDVPRLLVWGLRTQSEWDRGTQVITDIFERRHGVEVVTFSPGSYGPQKVITAIAGGEAPDLLPLGIYARDWVARGVLRPLDDLIARDRDEPYGIRPEDFYPASLEHVTADGHIYAIPDWAFPFSLYYNRSHLIEAGLVDDQGQPLPPRTWEEWQRYNVLLSRRDEDGRFLRVGTFPIGNLPTLFTVGRQMGATFLSPDGRTAQLRTEQSLHALRLLVASADLLGPRADLDAFRSSSQFAGLDPLLTGGVSMGVHGQWLITNFARFGPDIDFDVAPVPHPEGGEPVVFQQTYSFGIPSGARNVELAWEFLKWYSSEEAQLIKARETIEFTRDRGLAFTPFTVANRRINAEVFRRYIEGSDQFSARTQRVYAAFLEILEEARPRLPVTTPVGQLLHDELERATELAMSGDLSPSAALAAAEVRVQRALDHHWSVEDLPLVDWPRIAWGAAALLTVTAGGGALLYRRRLRRLAPRRRQEAWAGLLFVAPWIAGFTLFTSGPILVSLVLSFTSFTVVRPARWIGLANFRELFWTDPLAWKALSNTCFMLLGVPLNLMVGLGLALLLHRGVRGIALYRTVYYLPSIVPAVASSLLWIWIFHPQSGLANEALSWFGIAGPLWLEDPDWAKPAIIIHGLWGAGGGLLIWLAGLQGVPQSLYEAADIDGAGPWNRFRHITLPMLTPYIFFQLVMGTIGTLQIFTQAVVMTGGGPQDSTLFYVYHLFNNAFLYFRMGYASAMAWLLFALILAMTLVQLWLSRRWVYQEEGGK